MSKPHNAEKIVAIIPAAGLPSNRIYTHSTLPDAMIPINGKPVIGYILEDLIGRGIFKVVVALNSQDSYTEKYIVQKFSEKVQLEFVRTGTSRGVGYSIYQAALKSPESSSALIYLGDTIYKGPLSFTKDFLIVSKAYEDPQKWCFVESKNSGTLKFINKPFEYFGRGGVLSGLYFFSSNKDFLNAAKKCAATRQKIEVSHILENYQKNHKFALRQAERWYDCGNIENYYEAKIDFLRIRSFNTLTYNPVLGILTKSGKNVQKINQEINWFLNAPDEVKMLAPRLYDYRIGKNRSSYSVEYYGYQTLADIHMFAYINPALWQSIINRLFEIVGVFKKYRVRLPYSYFYDTYLNKLQYRLKEASKDPYWEKIFSLREVSVNGIAYLNINQLWEKVAKMVESLFEKRDMSFIHGDLCLGNILYDIDSRLIKLIDPRGYFGKMSVFGDIKYDLAKLRHSFSGCYDFITSDLFKLEEPAPGQYFYNVYTEDYHLKIAEAFDTKLQKLGYDLNQIKFIEALLFLSMLPLHTNSRARQKAMFLTGIKLINEVLK